jgi:hypothetical protein
MILVNHNLNSKSLGYISSSQSAEYQGTLIKTRDTTHTHIHTTQIEEKVWKKK